MSQDIARDQLVTELRKLATFYGVGRPVVHDLLLFLDNHLNDYAEFVLGENGFEVVTGGVGPRTADSLAAIAINQGASDECARAFSGCAKTFPECFMGLKLRIQADSKWPSLYVRTKTEKFKGIAFLSEWMPHTFVQSLEEKLVGTQMLYGLGFFDTLDHGFGVKTYSLTDVQSEHFPTSSSKTTVGFVSHRIDKSGIQTTCKEYVPNVAWSDLTAANARWAEIIRFAGEELGYESANHIGVLKDPNSSIEQPKLYIERIGAIRTDYAAV